MKASRPGYLFGFIALLAPVSTLPAIAQQTGQPEDQCLEVRVLDPSSASIQGATVTIGDREERTGNAGVARFCGLGPGPHWVIVTAENFQVNEGSVERSDGMVNITLQALLETELVVVGSRAQPRSVTKSPVPIDAIPLQDVISQGSTTLDYQLRTLVPSFNVATHPISDAATLVRPASLRNLAHDHTLVLVNGKRRHRSSVIAWFAGVTDGAQGPDISTIPSIALRQVEVLRDGASAQYGSDAIAGVINFLLKDARKGGSVEFNTGTYRAGDGDSYTIAGNVGLPLSETGFANLSLEYGNSDPTNRSVQRADAAALIAAGNTAVADPAQIWGNPTIEDEVKFFGNFGHLFSNGVQLYGHTNYAEKKVTEGFYFRNPNNRANIYSLDEGETLMIADVLDARDGVVDGSANCPTVRITDNVPDQAALARVFEDPNCFSFREIAPGGFTPQFGGVVTDMSVVGGVRGILANGLNWDASASYGAHESDFFFKNTVNASLGPETPREFDPGLYRQEDVNLNFDVSYAATDMINIAAGTEWRNERFEIGAGGRPSWEVGPYAAQGFVSGSNGFPGFPDYTAGAWDRSNVALYGDLELRDPGDRWTVGGALRFEHFDLFGSTTNGKLSARFGLSDVVSVRGGVSTGFRAPTPGQQNTLNVQTTIDPKTLQLVDSANVPSTFLAAELKGGKPLEPETSVNTTGWAGHRHRTVHADCRLLPRRPLQPPCPFANVHTHGGRTNAADLGGNRLRRHAGLLPVLHQRLLKSQPGDRPGLDVQPPRVGRQHGVQFCDELHPHGTDGRVEATHRRRRPGPGARRPPDPLERRRQPEGGPGRPAGTVELLRLVGGPLRRPVRPRCRFTPSGGPLHRRPGSEHPVGRRRDAGVRRPECPEHLIPADGPLRRYFRPPLQPVHPLGPERRLLLRPPQLHVGE